MLNSINIIEPHNKSIYLVFNRSSRRTADSSISFVREKLSWKITKKRRYSRKTLMSLMHQGEKLTRRANSNE